MELEKAKLNIVNNIDIEFKGLTYRVKLPTQKEKKIILKGISGKFKSGELTAIMGPSGAGKSSLMNILTGFIKTNVDGVIQFGNDNTKMRKMCCYIMQDDVFFNFFTVEESMMIATNLKISHKSMSIREKKLLIENILKRLKLSTARNTRCERLSGGQRKRLSIALELIDNPAVLFLDEPTTGLDSSSSLDTIELLQTLANEGRTIICTIHQPSSYIYEMFNQIYVLAKGYCVYQGTPQKTVQYLRSVNLECPPYHNPADFLLECVNGDYGDHVNSMAVAAQESEWCCGSLSNHAALTKFPAINNSITLTTNVNKYVYPPPEWVRMWILISRCHVQILRDWTITYLKLMLHIFCAILIGLLYGDSGSNAYKQVANFGSFLVHCVYLWYTTAMPAVFRFPEEIPIIKKETFNNWYKLRTYYCATFITTTPVHILFSTVYILIVYLMTDQILEVDRIVKVLLTCMCMTLCADGFGLMLGTILKPVNGVFCVAILTCFMLIYSGFLILLTHMSYVMRMVSFLSPLRYCLENFVIAIYDNNRPDTICPSNVIYCHMKSATTVLKTFGMHVGSFGFNILILTIHLTLYKICAYLVLKRRMKRAS